MLGDDPRFEATKTVLPCWFLTGSPPFKVVSRQFNTRAPASEAAGRLRGLRGAGDAFALGALARHRAAVLAYPGQNMEILAAAARRIHPGEYAGLRERLADSRGHALE